MDRKMFETERNTTMPVGHVVAFVWSGLLEQLCSSCAISGVACYGKKFQLRKDGLPGYFVCQNPDVLVLHNLA